MASLPWWARLLLPAVVQLLMALLSPFLDKEVSPEVKAAIFAFLSHLIGSDNQARAMKDIQDAHASCGIAGCPADLKKE